MTNKLPIIMESICSLYKFEDIGNGEYLVHTNMYFDDGDELYIVMMESDGGYTLTDEGHTMMWLSYEELRFTGNQKKLLDGILGQNDVTIANGEILTSIDSPEDVGPALLNMIQAIIQTSSLRYLSRNNAVNTFPEDMRSMFRNSEIRNKCLFKKEVKMCDGNFIEPDVYIDLPTPTLVFGVHNTERSKEVFINMLLISESKLDCRTSVFRVSPAKPSEILLRPSFLRMLHEISRVSTVLFSSRNTLSRDIPEKSKYTSVFMKIIIISEMTG